MKPKFTNVELLEIPMLLRDRITLLFILLSIWSRKHHGRHRMYVLVVVILMLAAKPVRQIFQSSRPSFTLPGATVVSFFCLPMPSPRLRLNFLLTLCFWSDVFESCGQGDYFICFFLDVMPPPTLPGSNRCEMLKLIYILCCLVCCLPSYHDRWINNKYRLFWLLATSNSCYCMVGKLKTALGIFSTKFMNCTWSFRWIPSITMTLRLHRKNLIDESKILQEGICHEHWVKFW